MCVQGASYHVTVLVVILEAKRQASVTRFSFAGPFADISATGIGDGILLIIHAHDGSPLHRWRLACIHGKCLIWLELAGHIHVSRVKFTAIYPFDGR